LGSQKFPFYPGFGFYNPNPRFLFKGERFLDWGTSLGVIFRPLSPLLGFWGQRKGFPNFWDLGKQKGF